MILLWTLMLQRATKDAYLASISITPCVTAFTKSYGTEKISVHFLRSILKRISLPSG